jgi:UDP-galactopyranose mutase
MSRSICIVGAGFSGAVIGRALAELGHKILIIDERNHVAGNCFTERDARTGVMTHKYGPHIFHTSNEDVWNYICRFGEMTPYQHRVIAHFGARVFSLPINLLTINQFFSAQFSPAQARDYLDRLGRKDIVDPENFEEQALSMMGDRIYHAFFRGYTRKQWGLEPRELPASILKRLPMRFDYDDRYFEHKYQAMPRQGYTDIIKNILDHPLIDVQLGRDFESLDGGFDHVVYSGPIDRFFHFELGRLGYRTLDFETFYGVGDVQGTAVLNYCDEDVPWTRITEHQHFAPWERGTHKESILYREFSRLCDDNDVPYYPIRLVNEEAMLRKYIERAKASSGVTFVGRLGTYRYIDMDVCIAEALKTADELAKALEQSLPPPIFTTPPM